VFKIVRYGSQLYTADVALTREAGSASEKLISNYKAKRCHKLEEPYLNL